MPSKPEELKRAFETERTYDFQLVWEKAGVLFFQDAGTLLVYILLGISPNKIDEIEAEGKPPRTCLRKVFDCWLKKDYDYKSHGVPTLRMLCNSIKSNSGGADPALADEIEKEYTINLTSSGEATTSPVNASSSKEATPTVELPTPTSPQFESSVVYVKKKSIEYSSNNLTRIIGDLKEVYLDNMYHTEKSFCSLDVSEVINFIQHYIALLLTFARDDYTLNDLYFFHKLIADALEQPINSVIHWLRLKSYVHKKKQLPDNELKKLHDSPIDIYDPLWYENTSTPLNEACWRGLKDEVQRLIDKTGLQERGDDDGVISLHMASYKGHLNIAQYLVNECHVDPDIADSSGNTGLLYSALGGHVDLTLSHNSPTKKSPDSLVKYMVDVAMGMHYIAERGLVHR
uniref:Uncharacterized protein n=1 Tax=Amphimedon queenslandica TaxID=400682 RepID=A0A1X7SY27_AMPQE